MYTDTTIMNASRNLLVLVVNLVQVLAVLVEGDFAP
jgi:hypothetical protein